MTYSVLYILSIFLSMAVLACHLLQWIALMVTVCILCVLRIIPQYWWPNWVSSRAWDGGQNQIARSLAHSKLTETLSFRTVSEPVRGQCLDKEEDVFGQIRKTLSEQGQGRCPNSVIDVVRTWPRTLSEQGQGRPVKSNKAKDVVWTRSRTSSQIQQGQDRCLNKTSNKTKDVRCLNKTLNVFRRRSRTFSHSQGRCLNEAKEKLKVSSFRSVTSDCYDLSLIHIWRCRRWP